MGGLGGGPEGGGAVGDRPGALGFREETDVCVCKDPECGWSCGLETSEREGTD